MKSRRQIRRAKLHSFAEERNLSDIMKRKSWPYMGTGFSIMGSKKRPKAPALTPRQNAAKMLGLKRLSPTKAQRRALNSALEEYLGYPVAKLSSQVAKPGNYTRTGTKLIVSPSGRIVREKFIVKRHHKAGQGKGGGSADREISHRTGTMKARKSAKFGKKGMRPGREAKKKSKKEKRN